MTINVKIHGDGAPLVLFHGWGFDSKIWMSLIPLLNTDIKSYRLYLVDLPGFGGTSYMDWLTFKDELLPLLPTEFAILGWSMGGLYATRLAIEEPNRVIQLINVASSPRFINDRDWIGIDNEVFNLFYNQLLENPKQTRIDFVKNQLKDGEIPSEFMDVSLSSVGLQSGLDLLVNWDLRPLLSELKQPVVYLFGKLDPIIPRRMMKLMQSQHPDFDYIMFNRAAHMPFLSHSGEFIKLLHEIIL
jgi:pimeloyl-[acyl-carrier protein] methyl ester esterase